MVDPNLISLVGGGRQAAAAKAKRRREEEEMTDYSSDKLAEGWEYKIIRSGTGAFRHRARLRQALEEEAQAGWELMEKFDDNRVRLRRPTAARSNDDHLDFDPYRTWIGVSEYGMVARALVVLAVVGAIILAIFLFTRM